MPKVATFRELRSDAANKTILKGRYGRAWQSVMGTAWDDELEMMYQARRARWPDFCPEDGLFYLGVERQLERVFLVGSTTPEATSDYRRRLREAWLIWERSGTQEAHRASFLWTGLSNVQVYRRKEWNSPPEDGLPSYVRAFQRDVWAQFDILIEPPLPWQPLVWGTFTWGKPRTWGTTATQADVDLLRRLSRLFRSGHSTPMWLVVNTTGGRLWGTWRWGDGTVWTVGAGQPVRWLVGETHWKTRGLV